MSVAVAVRQQDLYSPYHAFGPRPYHMHADRDQTYTYQFRNSPTISTVSPIDKTFPSPTTPVSIDVPQIKVSTPVETRSPKVRAPMFVDANPAWRERCIKASANDSWIEMLFANEEVLFGSSETGYAWKLERKVYERADFSAKQPYATALYECSQTRGRVRGPKAYMKVYMQIPCYCSACEHICTKNSDEPEWVTEEVAALRRMSQVEGYAAAPRLLATKKKAQSREMWVPGGYMTFIVMQRLPGAILSENTFWNLTSKTREEIRSAFKQALEYLWRDGIMPQHCGVEKLSWNASTRKCYVIDLAGSTIIGHAVQWWDDEYYRWGLSRGSFKPDETTQYHELESPDSPAKKSDDGLLSSDDPPNPKFTIPRKPLRKVRFELAAPNG